MRIKLACFDFDGTLMKDFSFTTIFAAFGLKERFNRELLDRWRAHEITLKEFDNGAALLLKGHSETEVVRKYALMKPMPGAAELVDYLHSNRIKTAIITCSLQYFPKMMAEKLGMDWWASNECEVKDGILTGKISRHNLATPKDKARVMGEYAKLVGCRLCEVAALGDSRIDLDMIKAAGLGIAVNPVDEETRTAAKYVVDDLHGALDVFRKELEKG